MMRKLIAFSVMGMLFVACSTVSYNRSNEPMLFSQLDSAPNGSTGELRSGGNFTIIDTQVNARLLCRNVRISTPSFTKMQRFCKIKGGEWR